MKEIVAVVGLSWLVVAGVAAVVGQIAAVVVAAFADSVGATEEGVDAVVGRRRDDVVAAIVATAVAVVGQTPSESQLMKLIN